MISDFKNMSNIEIFIRCWKICNAYTICELFSKIYCVLFLFNYVKTELKRN
jgi:hypothetical protein